MSAEASGSVVYMSNEEYKEYQSVVSSGQFDYDENALGTSIGSIYGIEGYQEQDASEGRPLNLSDDIIEKITKKEGLLVLLVNAHYSY